MFENKEKNYVVAGYDKLLQIKNQLERDLANIQRKKDLEVDKINKKYESKIEVILRQQKSNHMQIDLAKKYTSEN